MKRKWFILILCTIFLCLQGICFAVEDFSDNLRPITKEQINTIETREDLKAEGILDTAFPKCYLKPTPVELVHKLGIPNYAEFKKSDGTMSPSALPQQVSLLDYMPSIGSQKYNSCASFSLGYYGISYWNFIDKGMSPTSNPQHLGSHMYIFNQVNGGTDTGSPYLVFPYSITRQTGCAFQSDFALDNYVVLPDLDTQIQSLPQKTSRSAYFYIGTNESYPGSDRISTTTINDMKEVLASGVPIIVGIPYYSPTFGEDLLNAPLGTVYYGPSNYSSEYMGGHAIIIAGYYDDSGFPGGGCFYLRNSWGDEWGVSGDIWVTYDFIQDHSVEAYPIYDNTDYSPENYLVLSVEHSWRGDLHLDIKVNGNTERYYSPWWFNYNDSRDDLEVILDITEFISSSTRRIDVVFADQEPGDTGKVTQALYYANGEIMELEFENGYQIPDEGSITGTVILSTDGGGGGGGGCNTGEFNYSVVLLLLPLMFTLFKPKRFFQIKYFTEIFLVIAIISLIIIPTSCYASKPFNPSQEATRSQVCDHIVDACYGGYFWTGDGHRTPFLPKGFPTWKMRKNDVMKILGDDLSQKEIYGTEVLCYEDFDVLFQAGKLVGFHFATYLHKIMEQNLLRAEISDWRRVYPPEESNYETKDTDPNRSYKVRFATYKRSNPRYPVIAWVEKSGVDEGSYVCLSSFAKDIGILK